MVTAELSTKNTEFVQHDNVSNAQCQKDVIAHDIPNSSSELKGEEYEVEEISLRTESINLTTDGEEESNVVESNIDNFIEGNHEEEITLVDGELNRPGYRRMDLKGESESDKDLIIYSLNESLQIHKEIVERIQGEKDEIEYQYEVDREQELKEANEEKLRFEEKHSESAEKVNKLEAMYQALLRDVESKCTDYSMMENKFQSQVKDIQSEGDDLNAIQSQILRLLSQVTELCAPLSLTATTTTLDYFFERWPDMMNHCFENEELGTETIALLTEKMLFETLIHEILQTPIHPGITVNEAYNQIHQWIGKRNTSWAARLRRQIIAFLVKQSDDDSQNTEKLRKAMIGDVWEKMCSIYRIVSEDEKQDLKGKWVKIVNDTFKLNIAMKSHDNPGIDIMQIEEGSLFNQSLMRAYGEGDIVGFIISPPFVASLNSNDNSEGFSIPAKVFCI